jgi:hypothetical protein
MNRNERAGDASGKWHSADLASDLGDGIARARRRSTNYLLDNANVFIDTPWVP